MPMRMIEKIKEFFDTLIYLCILVIDTITSFALLLLILLPFIVMIYLAIVLNH